MKKIRRKEGDVLEIKLNGTRAFGRVLASPLVAFYDVESKDTRSLDEILGHKVAFTVPVMVDAITKGRWKVIGSAILESDFRDYPDFFKKDIISGEYFIHRRGIDIPATREDCLGLECAAVWEPEHIEERLRDHFAGRKNIWVERMKP